jgi:hypothetical protein
MMRSVGFLGVGTIIAAGLTCATPGSAQAPQPAASAVPPHRAQICDGVNPGSFIQAVKFVAEPFDPQNPGAGPQPTTQPLGALQADLQSAYSIAPAYLRSQLCQLDGIFITTDGHSWGFRNIATGQRYIALSTSLWSGNPASAITLDAYENRVLGPPLSWPTSDASRPNYLPATPNGGSMTILAALAHEFGHVLWADILIYPRGSNPNSANFCGRELDKSWTGGPLPASWTAFGDVDPNQADVPDDDVNDPPGQGDPSAGNVHIKKLLDALRSQPPQIERAHQILRRLLARPRPYPSLLGAFSANEHFVETFMLYTMMSATTPLTSAPLQVGPRTIRDIPGDLQPAANHPRPRLFRMLDCFKKLYPT